MGRKNRCKLKRKVKRKILKKNRNNKFLIKKNIFKDRDVSDIFKNLKI
jgi:hypothetical protein